MPINRRLDHLPVAGREGVPPVPDPVVVPLLAERWFEQYQQDNNIDLPHALPGRVYRASWAGKRCDRQLQYAMQRVPASNPPGVADYWRFGIGTMVHEALQRVLPATFPGAEVEQAVDLRPIGIDGSATADVIVRDDAGQAQFVVEIKTINGFGFKNAATSFKGPPEGPKWGHVVQGALAAAAVNAVDGLRVAYLSLENLSPNMATFADAEVGRFGAEWHIPLERCKEIARSEARRIAVVSKYVATDVLTARTLDDPSLPAGAIITNPDRGMWEVRQDSQVLDAGSIWFCSYCDHRDRCVADGVGGRLDSAVESPF